jgi:hypothetical protein
LVAALRLDSTSQIRIFSSQFVLSATISSFSPHNERVCSNRFG